MKSLIPSSPTWKTSVEINEVVLVKARDNFLRAIVRSVAERGGYNVYLIDTGGFMTTKKVACIPHCIAKIRPACLRCKINGVEPLNVDISEEEMYKEAFERFRKEVVIEIEFLYFQEGIHYIDIKLMDSGLRISKWLADKSLANRTKYLGYYMGMITSVIAPNTIYIHFDTDLLKKLSDEVMNQPKEELNEYINDKIIVGKSKGGRWYRAKRLEGMFAFLVDYGATRKMVEFRKLPKTELLMIPPQAYKYEISRSFEYTRLRMFVGHTLWIKIIAPGRFENVFIGDDELAKGSDLEMDQYSQWTKQDTLMCFSLREQTVPENGFRIERTPVECQEDKITRQLDLRNLNDQTIPENNVKYIKSFKHSKDLNRSFRDKSDDSSSEDDELENLDVIFDNSHFKSDKKFEIIDDELDDTASINNFEEMSLIASTITIKAICYGKLGYDSIVVDRPSTSEEEIFILSQNTSNYHECTVLRNPSKIKLISDRLSNLIKHPERTPSRQVENNTVVGIYYRQIWLRALKREDSFYAFDLDFEIDKCDAVTVLPKELFKFPRSVCQMIIEHSRKRRYSRLIRVKYSNLDESPIIAKEIAMAQTSTGIS